MWDINLKFTSDMQCINLLWVKVALLEFFFGTVDSLIFNSVKDQTARYCR